MNKTVNAAAFDEIERTRSALCCSTAVTMERPPTDRGPRVEQLLTRDSLLSAFSPQVRVAFDGEAFTIDEDSMQRVRAVGGDELVSRTVEAAKSALRLALRG